MIIQPDCPVILASASPRRKELLQQLGLSFLVFPAYLDEEYFQNETPVEHVCRLAEEKGSLISNIHPEAVVISADTIVVFRDRILGKPRDKDDAYRILRLLSGNTHEVITAWAIFHKQKQLHTLKKDTTEVTFRELPDKDIYEYIAGGSPMDKAGAYGIQDLDANFVYTIKGCFYNVIGFPTASFALEWNRLFTSETA